MCEKTVLRNQAGSIATLMLNRAASLNSLNKELVEELTAVLNAVKNDEAVRVVVLTGKGRAFCAGGDLNHLEQIAGTPAAKDFVARVGHLTALIREMPKPVIAKVNGVAAGAGFNLALACDLVVCAKTAKFAQSFAKVGLIPDCGGLYFLPRLAGLNKAKELMFTGDIIDAAAAFELGLINCVVEADQLESEVNALAEKLAAAAPQAIALTKQTLNNSDKMTLTETLTLEAELQERCLATQDYAEGVTAFREKRAPVFTGK